MDDSEKICPVCQDTLQDPAQLPCNHEFCQSCLQRALNFRRHCPVCRKSVNNDYICTAVPSQTRRARSNQPNEDSSKPACFPQCPLIPATAPAFSSVPLIPTTAPAPAPALTPPAQLFTPPALTLPMLPFPTYTAAQSTGLAHLPIRRLFQSYTFPQVNVQDPPGLPVTENENEEIQNLLNEQAQVEQSGTLPNNSVRVFVCPYCQQGGMDELDLRNHCNTHHRHDPTRVVCPVCVALPHGDENYYSRDFIGHLNLRHSYYSADITNTHQSDAMNIQAAIMESFRTLPNPSTNF